MSLYTLLHNRKIIAYPQGSFSTDHLSTMNSTKLGFIVSYGLVRHVSKARFQCRGGDKDPGGFVSECDFLWNWRSLHLLN